MTNKGDASADPSAGHNDAGRSSPGIPARSALALAACTWPLLAAAAVAAIRLTGDGVRVVGEIPAGLPTLQLPDIHPADLWELLLPAFGVMIVAFSDDVLTGRSFAQPGQRVEERGRLAQGRFGCGRR